MALNIQIKESKKDFFVGHSKICKPLGQQTPDELLSLAIIARESNDPSMIALFSVLPTLTELKAARTEQQLAAIAAEATAVPAPEVTPAPATALVEEVAAPAPTKKLNIPVPSVPADGNKDKTGDTATNSSTTK